MIKFIRKNKWNILISVVFALFVVGAYHSGFSGGKVIARNFKKLFLEMIYFIPPMFAMIGLFEVWFPKERVERHIGPGSGVKGIIWVVLLAMLQAGPLYGSFPVAYLLWKKGGSIRNVFIYLGAFSTIKIPMLMFEVGFMGLKFALLRTFVTLPLFIATGFVMDWYLKGKNFRIAGA